MIKVITYGTYDLLHYGHIRLLERAKKLGDYLVVGVTSDDFDKSRGKINVQQSLMERIESVRKTGLADEIIVEEYQGQKIDDIVSMGIDIFAIGSDWKGKFDYLEEYCKVIYLDRTEGVSSSQLRNEKSKVRIGMYGDSGLNEFLKYINECSYVNGAELVGICDEKGAISSSFDFGKTVVFDNYGEMLENCDAVFLETEPSNRYAQIKKALEMKKHVLCKAPVAIKVRECDELFNIANESSLVLMGAVKTAYATAYNRLLLLLKSGVIGKVLHIDATCTRLEQDKSFGYNNNDGWNSICTWGPFVMLPVFQILGTVYQEKRITSYFETGSSVYDIFTKVDFRYKNATATVKVGKGVKSEGALVITGTEGYIYVPAPWWKTDYFEIRYEHQEDLKRYFYQLAGEGIRSEIASFVGAVKGRLRHDFVDDDIIRSITSVIEDFYSGDKMDRISITK